MRASVVAALLLLAFVFTPASATAALPARSWADGQLHVDFLDVGQGDAIYLEGPGGRNLLVDAGGEDQTAVVDHLRARGVGRLDTVLVTHPHDDHFGGLSHLVGRLPVGRFLYGTRVEAPRWRALEELLDGAGVERRHVEAGEVFDLGGGAQARVLHTGPAEAPGIKETTPETDVNGYSVVLYVTFGRTSYMLGGDATGAVEDELAGGELERATVLKVSHHGSRGSTTERFLAAVRPTWAVVQAGRANDFGHPHEATLQRLQSIGSVVYRTDLLGTVPTRSDGVSVAVGPLSAKR